MRSCVFLASSMARLREGRGPSRALLSKGFTIPTGQPSLVTTCRSKMNRYAQDDIDVECLEDLLPSDDSIPIRDGHRPKMPDKVRETVFRVPHGARIPVSFFSTSKPKSSASQSSCPVLSFSSSKGSIPGDQANFPRAPTDADAVPRYIPKTAHTARLDNRTSPVVLPYEPM
jgi:hypothetical protein